MGKEIKARKTRAYVCGRMRGLPQYGFERFDKARDRLLSLGFDVVSPADIDRATGFDPYLLPLDTDWNTVVPQLDEAEIMARDIDALDHCDAIYIITDGIEHSKGAAIEMAHAAKRGLTLLRDTMDDDELRLCALWGDVVDTVDKWHTIGHAQQVPTLSPVTAAEVRYTDPATGGQKGEKLARYDLVPPDIHHELAEHYGKGAVKYGERNMEKGYPWSKTYAACHRHLNAFWRGEDVDAETGSLHLIAAAWHCFTMAWFLRHGKGTDDRPKAEGVKA
jgi:hypothetical protein